MRSSPIDVIRRYIEAHMDEFHGKRIACLQALKLDELLKCKNPYIFRAKDFQVVADLVRHLLDAHLSSQEETLFGDFLEGLAIFINTQAFGGWKSSAEGLDLEFDRQGKRHIVSIKSGPNWGNSSQIKKMTGNFKTAAKVLRQRNPELQVIAVNGCCYGTDSSPDKGDYFKYCGQDFWTFVSGDPDLYLHLIDPLGHQAKERNAFFIQNHAKIVNQFTSEFSAQFCREGSIDWEALVRFNSACSRIPPTPFT